MYSCSQNGTTALHQAAQSGYADVIRILLDHGADIDVPDSVSTDLLIYYLFIN